MNRMVRGLLRSVVVIELAMTTPVLAQDPVGPT
jgi:hypothetical protein